MSIPTNNIVQLMLLVNWTKIESSMRHVKACPNLDHEIELFRYVQTVPRVLIRKTQTLPSGTAIDDELSKQNTIDFFTALFENWSSRVSCIVQRVNSETCSLSVLIENGSSCFRL